MNFKSLYAETKENIELALLSLWTPANHRMRKVVNELIRREPLFAEPVFQSMFPWKDTTDPNWRDYITPEVVQIQEKKAAKNGYVYTPFEHQTKSWKQLKDGNSIVVTSGTGSGKTECFMLPILSDIYSRRNNYNGNDPVEAIFLYPLNALMQDQKDRLGSDCQELGLKFAVYNSSLKESKAVGSVNPNYPNAEVRTRISVRTMQTNGCPSCPQILLTNPSMLEYMLVRNSDQPIFERSKGKLKWIVIDEAHTYTGSAAIELAYLIKRVLSAFNVERSDVQFVCTSATIGDPNKPQELLDFIETITGEIPAGCGQKLVHVDGNRIVPPMRIADVQVALQNVGLRNISPTNVLKLRDDINRQPLSLSTIWATLTNQQYCVESCLDLLDKLCNIKIDDNYLLMAKGHFFMRSINGLYACVNECCSAYKLGEGSGFGYLTTEKGTSRCPHCGAQLLEVVQCRDCKEFMIVCEENDQHEVRPTYVLSEQINIDDEDDGDNDDNDTDGGILTDEGWQKLYLANFGNGRVYTKPHPNYYESKISISWNGTSFIASEAINSNWYKLANNDKLYCPNCVSGSGEEGTNFHSFRLPANWVNGVIAPALLQEGRDDKNDWGKYIAFTDSRQGTAINAKRFNIDSERSYSRSRIVDQLSDSNNHPQIKQLKNARLPEEIFQQAVAALNLGDQIPTFSLKEFADCIFSQHIFDHIDFDASKHYTGRTHTKDEEAYKNALLRSNIGRRPMHLASLESLGLITMSYPSIENAQLPNNWSNAGFTKEEYQAFLKICVDFHIRMGNHIQCYYPNEIQYIRESNRSTPYDPADWPKVHIENAQPKITQNRLILLLCAALGIHDIASLAQNEHKINNLMNDAWIYLSTHTLNKVDTNNAYYKEIDDQGNHKFDGWYYIDLSINSNKCIIKAAQKLYVCPFNYNLLDTTFRGYSPAIKGPVCAENFNRFKLSADSKVSMPIYRSKDFEDKKAELISKGIWSDRHKYAYQPSKEGYLTAEHSGQQDRDILDHYTAQFKCRPHKLNLLQCSTTMEMGVDIGDIDTVLMTSVPPTSANYLQRTGRAGRRGQSKAVAISLCPHTSIGIQAYRNPMRNLISRNPAIKPVESAIIVQRHMNSFLVREYVTANDVAFSKVHEWLCENGFYSEFKDWIGARRKDVNIKNKFTGVFGNVNMSNAIDSAITAIDAIANDYQVVINNIETEIINSRGNQAKIDALSIQEAILCNQELKEYLAEKQFLPNADMPTGVVEFNYIDKDNYDELKRLRTTLERKRKELIDATLQGNITNLKHQIIKLQSDIEKIKEKNVTSREIKLALSEYAPGQMVVINERNYISAGIEWKNSFGQQQPLKCLYHCPSCGRYEYTSDSTLTTCGCGSLYRNILNPNHRQQYAIAIEPIRFRTDVNRGINRQEHTVKTFYQIQTVLTNVDWGNCVAGPQCDIVGSDDAQGDIVFYNVGAGSGFSLCLDCGKMEVSRGQRTTTNWLHKDITQHDVSCPVNHPYNNVLLSGKFPTSFVSLRFYRDASRTEYVDDVDLLYSLGVIICKSLVQVIGVDDNEVDFDVRPEGKYSSIYIYDTSKGGCGYSTELLDSFILNKTFDIAKGLLRSFTCHCENQVNGACVRCLVDRNSQRYEKNLSKHKLLAWFTGQTMSMAVSSTGARAVPMPLKLLATQLYSKASNQDFTFCADANNMNVLDWTIRDGSMGRIIHECINRGKNVTILVSNVPNAQKGAKLSDIIPFIDFPSKFPNCKVKAVESLETSSSVYSALIINNKVHYFTETEGVLELNEYWGDKCTHLFVDDNIPSFVDGLFPSINDVKALTQPNEITRSATLKDLGNIRLNELYSIIKNSLLHGNDEQDVAKILSKKKVNVTFSDSYVNSALAALILVNLIKEIKKTYDFEINEVHLQIQGPKRNCYNDKWSDYAWLSWSFPNSIEADKYIREVFEEYLDITPSFSPIIPDHFRWLRFQPLGEDKYIEIRPDHGILGVWQSKHKYGDLNYITEYSEIECKDNTSIVYYLIIKK